MKLKELYKKVRKNQEVSLDEDSMWNNIESRLEEPKKKRRFIWLWFFIGVLVIAMYTGLNSFRDSFKDANSSLVSPSSVKETQLSSNSELNTPESNNDIENTNFEENSKSDKSEDIILEKRNNFSNVKSKFFIDRSQVKKNLIKQNSAFNSNILERYIDRNENTTIIRSVIEEFANSNIRSKSIIEDLQIDLIPTFSFSTLKSKTNGLGFSSQLLMAPSSSLDSPNTDEKERMKEKLEFTFSVDYLNPYSIVIEKNLPFYTWSDLHSNSKSSISAFQVSNILKYRFESGIGIGSGLNIRQVNEWYDAKVETYTPIGIASDSAAFVIIEGIKQFKTGVLTGTQIDRTYYHTPVRRFYIDIPIELSYTKSWNKLNAELSVAYNLNISHSYYGRSFAEAKELLDNDQLNLQKIYKNNLVNSTNIGLKLNHQFTSKTSIGLSINYWYQLNSSLNSNSTLNENYRGFGGGLNLKRTFSE